MLLPLNTLLAESEVTLKKEFRQLWNWSLEHYIPLQTGKSDVHEFSIVLWAPDITANSKL